MRFSTILSRTQLVVVGFFVLVWIALVATLVLSPEVYTETLRKVSGDGLAIEAAFVVTLSALLALLVVGVVRRWRWTFWLVLIARWWRAIEKPAFGETSDPAGADLRDHRRAGMSGAGFV